MSSVRSSSSPGEINGSDGSSNITPYQYHDNLYEQFFTLCDAYNLHSDNNRQQKCRDTMTAELSLCDAYAFYSDNNYWMRVTTSKNKRGGCSKEKAVAADNIVKQTETEPTYEGVTFDGCQNKYTVTVCINGRDCNLGVYSLGSDAAFTFDIAEKLLKGTNCKLNFRGHGEYLRARDIELRKRGDCIYETESCIDVGWEIKKFLMILSTTVERKSVGRFKESSDSVTINEYSLPKKDCVLPQLDYKVLTCLDVGGSKSLNSKVTTPNKRKKSSGRETLASSNESSTTETETVADVFEPTDLDVLRGRGGLTNHHAGNKRFRDEARKLRREYRDSNTDSRKKFRLSQVWELHLCLLTQHVRHFISKLTSHLY
jgi:hypothetical protein